VKVSWDHHSFQLEDITLEKYMKHYETIDQMSVSKGAHRKNCRFFEHFVPGKMTVEAWDDLGLRFPTVISSERRTGSYFRY